MLLQSPMPGYKVTTRYGPRGSVAGLPAGLHNGDDHAAPTGTPVYAAADGVVRLGYEQGGFGNFVVIAHGDNLTTWYAHLSAYGVPTGRKVRAGDLIGYVGSTGASTGPHLHFSARRGGTWIDPQSLMQAAASAPSGRKKTMSTLYVSTSNDKRPGSGGTNPVWALAGDSPGTDANWLESKDQTVANGWAGAHGNAVWLGKASFDDFKRQYRQAVKTR